MKMYNILGALCLLGQSVLSQQAPSQGIIPDDALITGAYATGGDSPYKDNVLWLTWGAQGKNDTYGKFDQGILSGTSSYARIDLGEGIFLDVKATISDIQVKQGGNGWGPAAIGDLKSYSSGDWRGDALHKLYNIGGEGGENKLINGLRTTNAHGSQVKFTMTCVATLGGVPIKLNGLVLADVEEMGNNHERASLTGPGSWTVMEFANYSTNKNPYKVSKTVESDGRQTFMIGPGVGGGNPITTVGYLSFNEDAYKGELNEVSFDVLLIGEGKSGIAIGLIPPSLDGGDAPESYGAAWHMLEGFVPGDDKIVADEAGTVVNINTTDFTPAGLTAVSHSFLGSTAPDSDGTTNYSVLADGDDLNGSAGLNEEDAWPKELKRISYNKFKGEFEVTIPYSAKRASFIRGWIDFNGNGEFDDSEASEIVEAEVADNATVILKWDIPMDRKFRRSYVRLRMAYNAQDLDSPDSSTKDGNTRIAQGGEVEDHTFYIVGPARTNPMLPSKTKYSDQVKATKSENSEVFN